jgi:hypothetical protein
MEQTPIKQLVTSYQSMQQSQPASQVTGPLMNESVSDATRKRIMTKLIEPSYYRDVRNTIIARSGWRISGQIFETTSKILIAVSGIIGFASGFFPDYKLGFYAGTASTLSLASVQFAMYCFKEGKENVEELNMILQKIRIDTVPMFDDQSGAEAKNTLGHTTVPIPVSVPIPVPIPVPNPIVKETKNITIEQLDPSGSVVQSS